MIMRRQPIFLTASAFALVASLQGQAIAACARDPSPKLSPAWIGDEFKQMMNDCLPGQNAITFKKRPKTVSFVPPSVVAALATPATEHYADLGSATMTRLFGYVFNAAEKANPDAFTAVDQHYLSIDYTANKDQIAAPGLGSTIFNRDCASVLKLAADTHGGGGFGPATLEAALSSAINNTFSARINLAAGNFVNPLPQMWSGSTTEPNRREVLQFYAALLFWDWYNRNPDATGPLYLLNAVNGVSLYRFAEQEGRFNASTSASTDVAIPFLSASFKAEGNALETNTLNIEHFQFARRVRDGDPDAYLNFFPMPSRADVLRRIALNGQVLTSVYPDAGEDDVAVPGKDKNLVIDVEGLSGAFCNRLLKVEGPSASNIGRLSTEAFATAEGVRGCRIKTRYSVPASGGEAVAFDISSKDMQTRDADAPFLIRAAKTFAKSARPTVAGLVAASPPQATSAGSSITRLMWSASGALLDEGYVSDKSGVIIDKFGVRECFADAERVAGFTPDFAIGTRSDASQRPITFTVTADYKNLKSDWIARARTCRVGGDIGIMTPAGVVRRSIYGFEFPVPAPEDTVPDSIPPGSG